MSLVWTFAVLILTGVVAWRAPGSRWANGSLVIQPGDAVPVKEAARRLLSEYRRQVMLAVAGAGVAVLSFHWRLGDSYWRLIFPTFALICGALTWRVQLRMRNIRISHVQRREAYLVIDQLEELPRWPWFAAMAALVLAAVYLAALWQSIPAYVPVHWNFAGVANGWSERTVFGVYRPVLLGAAIVAGMYGLLQVCRWSVRRQWQTLDEEARGQELLRLRVLTFAPAWIALGCSLLGLWLPFAGQPTLTVTLTAVTLYLAGIAVIIFVCARLAD